MSNPYFSNSKIFGERRAVNPYPSRGQARGQAQQQGGPWGNQPIPGGAQATATPGYEQQFAGVEQSFYGPSAGSAQTGRLTYDDVIMKTAGVLAVVVGVAVASWFLVPPALTLPAMIVGALGGFVLGLVNAFKREPSPALILGYAALEGVFLGMISGFFETLWPGIVVQAVLATFVTFGVTLALFKSGKVRVTPKFTKVLMIGLISYGIFCLVNLGVMWFTDMGGAFGMRSMEIFGLPIGVVIGAVAVLLAAMSLVMDFDAIKRGVEAGAPRKFAWAAAFGITVTLIWLYIEFLRILAILRGGD
ncbi:Bax inhibitor-1/YccA family membrane protein [Ruania zhangjianzhongii]|uniref:Bax inhibitor-1/YccA family protein n=1 Tax=Ruania zhangjianzhongii TaxID=2603206 RepID=UPI0011C751D5|nr:Bax inhibitor-1/YccA family protein [Ruania zhangjianzhongii]